MKQSHQSKVHSRDQNLATVERILFLRLRLLGDIIFTIPAIQLFKKKNPECKIYYVVEEKFSEMAELIPVVEKGIPITMVNAGKANRTYKALIGAKVEGTIIEKD